MPQMQDMNTILEQLHTPAFLVQDGIISAANNAAIQHFVEIGAPVSDLIVTGAEEYATFNSGSLYLAIRLGGTQFPCTITQLQEQQLFQIEESQESKELLALSLAAAQISMPLSELALLTGRLSDTAEKAKIQHNLHKLQRILGNMSDAWQYVNTSPAMVTCDLCSIMQEVLEKAATLLAESKVTIRYSVPNQAIYSLAEPEMLRRAVYNLLSNAVKFSPPGCIIDASVTQSGNKLYLTVSNQPNQAPLSGGSIFHRYKRSPGLENPKYGIGLGMTLVHGTATAHGGTILVEQMQEHSVRITISLAIRRSQENNVRSPVIIPDIYGGQDQALIELSDVLPSTLI